MLLLHSIDAVHFTPRPMSTRAAFATLRIKLAAALEKAPLARSPACVGKGYLKVGAGALGLHRGHRGVRGKRTSAGVQP